MLVKRSQQSFEQLIESLTMRIQLTEPLKESLRKERGATPTNPFELRGASRFRCFGECIATLDPDSFPMPGQELQSLAFVRDLSRKGVGIISHQQWYPEQVLELQLENAVVEARVARTRRHAPLCYEVGLMIVKYEARSQPES
jgi:hypothetical protein